MKLGNAAWGFRETALEEQLKITHDMGLVALELGIANAENDVPIDATNENLENVKMLYDKYGIELSCGATGNDFSNGNYDDVDKIKKVIEICSKLGITYLRIFAGFSHVEDVVGKRWEVMIECIKQSDDYAQKMGVILTIETHGGVNGYEDGVEHFMSTSSKPESLYKMLDEIPESVMINFDPANLWAVGIAHPENVYKIIKKRVGVIHLKDFVTLESGHLKPDACGTSDMDWNLILKTLGDFKGNVFFEYENTEDVRDGLQRSNRYIKSVGNMSI